MATLVTAPSSTWQRTLDALALFLLAYGAMNLNGIVNAATGIDGALSNLVLVASLLLLVGCAERHHISSSYAWLALFLALYLILGLLPLINDGSFQSAHLTQYAGSIVYCSALYFYITKRGSDGLAQILPALQVMFFIDCLAALNYKTLGAILPFAEKSDRATGFFANPNETAAMALYALVLLVALPPRTRGLAISAMITAFATLVLTFSKTNYMLLVVLGAFYLLSRRSYRTLFVVVALTVLLLPVLHYLAAENPLGLVRDQRLRLEQFVGIFTGEINDKTTTGRSELWAFGLRRIYETFPWGTGLATFSTMEGGVRDVTGPWLGVHNVFLMVLGESGPLPLLALLIYLGTLIRSSVLSTQSVLCMGALIVVIGDMMVSHGALVIRLNDLMLAVVMAACFISPAGPQNRQSDPSVARPLRNPNR